VKQPSVETLQSDPSRDVNRIKYGCSRKHRHDRVVAIVVPVVSAVANAKVEPKNENECSSKIQHDLKTNVVLTKKTPPDVTIHGKSIGLYLYTNQ
jgi:hypothetical protein